MKTGLENIESQDQNTLWDALYIALWDAPDEPRRPRSCLSDPGIAVYASEWGTRELDFGLKSVTNDGIVSGMIWSRLIPNRAGAYWDDRTPQLGLAVFPDYQGQGLGRQLMHAYWEAAAVLQPGVSLGVHPKNEVALGLYQAFGFETFATGPKGYLHRHRSCLPAGD